MKRYYLIVAIALLFKANYTYGQLEKEFPRFNSPQLASVLRFDNTPVDMHSGRFDLSIPVIDFQDKDFDLPVSLKYNSTGFRPMEPDNFVGLNWSLMPVCVINRIVKGMPDDWPEKLETNADYPREVFRGFLSVKNNNVGVTKEQIFSNPATYAPLGTTGTPRIKGTDIEASSDIYQFSFGKYSGHFSIDYNGQVSVVNHSGGILKVDIHGYDLMPNRPNTYTSKIGIKTDDGFTYVFGGSFSAMEYLVHSWKEVYRHENTVPTPLPEVNAFYLSEIIAPNGRVLKIEYDDTIDRLYNHFHANPRSLLTSSSRPRELLNCYQLKAYSAVVFETMAALFETHLSVSSELKNKFFSLNKIALIKRIYTDDGQEILYQYSQRTRNMFSSITDAYGLGFNVAGIKLDAVIYRRGGTVIESTAFTYEDNGRLFLKQVKNSKKGTWRFNYKTQTFVDPLTIHIDHWNFTKGNSTNTNLVPTFIVGESPFQEHFTMTTDNRAPGTSGVDQNMLSEVIFPTGGKAVYNYEQHDYRRMVKKDYSTDFMPTPSTLTTNQTAGGLRIKYITYYNQDASISKRMEYRYRSSLTDATSSGMLTQYPRYIFTHRKRESSSSDGYSIGFNISSIGYDQMIGESAHVTYSNVIEIQTTPTGTNGGYKLVRFSDYQSNTGPANDNMLAPFQKIYEFTLDNGFSALFYDEDIHFYRNQFRDPLDLSNERGKLLEERYYSSTGSTLKSIIYEYGKIPDDGTGMQYPENPNTPYTVYINTPRFMKSTSYRRFSQVNKRLYYNYNLVKKTTRDYTTTGTTTTVENYKYSYPNSYLKQSDLIDSDGKTTTVKYIYAHECSATNTVCNTMKSKNVMSPLRYEVKLVDSEYIYSIQHDYGLVANAYTGNQWYGWNQMPVRTSSKIVFDKTKINGLPIENDTETKDVVYSNYDVYGNPTCITENGDTETIYIWGHYGQYPVAEIKNSTYQKVSSAVSAAFSNTVPGLSKWPSFTLENLMPLKNNAHLKDALVTLYTYKPLVGISSVTPPNNNTIYYDYYDNGKLKEVYRMEEGQKQVLEYFQYNYVNP